MDSEPKVKRSKKSDKKKATHEFRGGFSQKHVRRYEDRESKKPK